MIVQCPKCGRYYDDARRWTICPHNELDKPHDWLVERKEPMNPNQDQAAPAPKRHHAIEAILQFFSYTHLPPHLQAASKPFCDLANQIADGPQNAEATVALRKLLEAKDAAVRAVLFK